MHRSLCTPRPPDPFIDSRLCPATSDPYGPGAL
jgi:hypothetical protein